MPEPDLEFEASNVLVEWGSFRLIGPGVLRLTSEELVLGANVGGALRTKYEDVHGGGWRTGTLTIHGQSGKAVIESSRGLDHAWAQLIERACVLPEMARAHRLLGSRRGGSANAQAKLLAPLLQARKRVEEARDLDARVEALEARALRERVSSALENIARDAYPSSHPDRRGLEAELGEALMPFFAGLDALDVAARHFRSAPEAIRFVAWRRWVATVSNAFILADSGWASAARLLPTPIKP
jgi:hypothetical protein